MNEASEKLMLIRDVMIGTMVYAIILTGGIFMFQKYLLLIRNFGQLIHWTAILILVPILGANLLKLLKVQHKSQSILIGSMIAMVILFPLYSTVFWTRSPTVLETGIFMFVIIGMGHIAAIPLMENVKLVLAQIIPAKTKGNRKLSKAAEQENRDKSTVALINLIFGATSFLAAMATIVSFFKS